MVEPLPYHRDADGALTLLKDAQSLARAITIASGARDDQRLHLAEDAVLRRPRGWSSAPPPCPASCSAACPAPTRRSDLRSWGRALVQPAVRGLVVGRALLYPPGTGTTPSRPLWSCAPPAGSCSAAQPGELRRRLRIDTLVEAPRRGR